MLRKLQFTKSHKKLQRGECLPHKHFLGKFEEIRAKRPLHRQTIACSYKYYACSCFARFSSSNLCLSEQLL